MIINRPSAPDMPRLVLPSAARAIASGSCTRISVNAAYRSRFVAPDTTGDVNTSDMLHLPDQRLHLIGGGHRGGTLPPGRDDRPRRVPEPQNRFQVPPGQLFIAPRTT